jgi:hypothetical protein
MLAPGRGHSRSLTLLRYAKIGKGWSFVFRRFRAATARSVAPVALSARSP